jgi:hypothetical protein
MLLLLLDAVPRAKRRFSFESFWVKLPGFLEGVEQAWSQPVMNVDPFRVLDYKLRQVAKALQSWSSNKIGSVWLQFALAREVILRFDEAQEFRPPSTQEIGLRKSLKLRTLGLASMARTIARQRSRLQFLAEGDANTKFFHLQACHRGRKNKIHSLWVEGSEVVTELQMAQALYDHYNSVLGSSFERCRRVNLSAIGLPSLDLSDLEVLFTEDKVRALPESQALPTASVFADGQRISRRQSNALLTATARRWQIPTVGKGPLCRQPGRR